MAESQISNKIWNIASVLRDGGVSYGDYLEQITFLLFLKMVDENKKMAATDPELQMFSMEGMDIPDNFEWTQLASLQGEDLISNYEKLLADLSKRKGMIGEIYRGARNKVEKASLLKKVVDMIDAVDWSSQSEDVKGDIYESLLQRIAQDTKSGAGQYFTPRALINVIVKCVNPKFSEDTKIADPCCGSGGFLLATRKYFENVHSERLNKALQESVFRGTEYVESTYRMCLMNLLLHGIGTFNGVPPIKCQDSLAHAPGDGDLCDYVLTNPPFGKKASQTIEVEKEDKDGNIITVLEKEKDSYTRQDFIATTSNKQLNFVQHIKSMLKVGGQAAVVLPDNVLFEGNAGEIIRKNLLKTCDLHTILRLPTGIFYAQGVKANVLFFEKRPASETIHTKEVWIYDYRTNIHHTLKQNPLKESDLDEFISCYNPTDRHNRKETYNEETNTDGRWRKYSYDEIIKRDKTSLDITWLKQEDYTEDIPLSELLANIEDKSINISEAVKQLKALMADIEE
ncbi:MAG: type I restriction-modification system subunit M [Paludibacteraceae bacterium]|nr:type I restriction-modification system subunit M [Paludibacteraceae bacterium]